MRIKEFLGRGFRPVLRAIVFGSIFFLGVTPAVRAKDEPAKDKNECAEKSLKGPYGYTIEGLRFPSPPSAVGVELVGAAGLMVFDGEGSLTAQDTFHTAGTIGVVGHRTGTGSYTVASNCTGSAELGGDFGGLTFNFSIFRGGREFAFLVTNPGTVQPGAAMTTGDEECTLASFKGAYTNVRLHDYRGPFFTLVNAGLEDLTVDGRGNMVFPPITQTVNGVFSHPSATGSYRVFSNCLFSLDVLITNEDGTTSRVIREGVVVDGGNQVWAIGAAIPASPTVGFARFKRRSLHGGDD